MSVVRSSERSKANRCGCRGSGCIAGSPPEARHSGSRFKRGRSLRRPQGFGDEGEFAQDAGTSPPPRSAVAARASGARTRRSDVAPCAEGAGGSSADGGEAQKVATERGHGFRLDLRISDWLRDLVSVEDDWLHYSQARVDVAPAV